MWERVLAVNPTGVWLSNKAVVPAMEAQGGGSIINQASIGGLVGFSGMLPYPAAKAGVIGLTRQGHRRIAMGHRWRVSARWWIHRCLSAALNA